MELSSEDSLRLNVLLAQPVQAIRIDESSMVLYAMTATGEATVRLTPNCRDDLYVRRVRELVSGQVLGSPEGYPVFLRRWTRMGQISGVGLDDLLKLAEPEAVVAVACAPDLTDELARRAWWAFPDAEVARRMLAHRAVAGGAMGRVLAEYLVEFLPFEEDPTLVMESVRLVLQPGLITPEQRRLLWNRGKRKNAYHVGFLATTPDDLPDQSSARWVSERRIEDLERLAEGGNPYAGQWLRVCSASGQSFLETAEAVLTRPPNQEVVLGLFDAIGDYFRTVAPSRPGDSDMGVILQSTAALVAGPALTAAEGWPEGLAGMLQAVPELAAEMRAMLVLARLGEPVLRPLFSRTDAIGSLLRKKLTPISKPVLEQLAMLRGRG